MTDVGTVSADVQGRLDQFLGAVELVDVRTVAVSGELTAEAVVKPTDVRFEVRTGYRLEDGGRLLIRYNASLAVLGEEEKQIANVGTAVVLILGGPINEVPDKAVMELLAGEPGLMIVGPFIREVFQSVVVRLGLPALTMGLFRAGSHALNITFRQDD